MRPPPQGDGGANGEGIRDGHIPEGRFQTGVNPHF